MMASPKSDNDTIAAICPVCGGWVSIATTGLLKKRLRNELLGEIHEVATELGTDVKMCTSQSIRDGSFAPCRPECERRADEEESEEDQMLLAGFE